MYRTVISVVLAAAVTGSVAQAAPIDARSQLSLTHTWLLNSGNVPGGISVENLSNTLVIDTDISTMIDDPAANEVLSQNFVVGNPFSDPIVPVQSNGLSTTAVNGNADFAIASYNYEIAVEDDPEDGVFDITRRDIDQEGLARVNMQVNQVDGTAISSHVGGRSFRFVNETNDLISFNLTGLFEAELSASVDGAPGIARTSGGFGLVFDVGQGAEITYFPVAPYLSTRTETGLGAEVSDLFLANSGGVTGVSFGASTTALGDGGFTEAAFSANSRYVFGVSLDGGASVLLQTSFFQNNSVVVEPVPDIVTVSEPATMWVMLAGLAGFAVRQRKRAAV